MQTARGNLHLEIQTACKSPVGILRTTFRELVVPVDAPETFKILYSREYGASSNHITKLVMYNQRSFSVSSMLLS